MCCLAESIRDVRASDNESRGYIFKQDILIIIINIIISVHKEYQWTACMYGLII